MYRYVLVYTHTGIYRYHGGVILRWSCDDLLRSPWSVQRYDSRVCSSIYTSIYSQLTLYALAAHAVAAVVHLDSLG
jgi:hypothetical protein